MRTDLDLPRVVYEYEDVFPDELPVGLVTSQATRARLGLSSKKARLGLSS